MRWLGRDMWRVGVALTGILVLLILMVWIPVSAADAQTGTVRIATTATVQATPKVDLTVTALAKEQLALQVKQLQNQLQDQNNWLANNSTALIAAIATVIVALFGISQWAINRRDERRKEVAAQDKELQDREAERLRRDEEQRRWLEDRRAERERQDDEQRRWMEDHQAEREKRAEERFQSVIEGLGSTSRATQVGAAIMLRTFLQPDNEQFYRQAFDLAVAHLRLRHLDLDKPESLDSLSQALIAVFKEVFPRARDRLKRNTQFLDATGIQLDNAYLPGADLKRVWMRESYLRNADLNEIELSNADLEGTNLMGAKLHRAKLEEANLWGANLEDTDLSWAKLNRAYLSEAKLNRANLTLADLRGTHIILADLREASLEGADLTAADLRRARLIGANLLKAKLNETELEGADLTMTTLRGANPEEALSLKDTNLRGAIGLTRKQLLACKAKGAIIDEDIMANPPQPIVGLPTQVTTPPVSTDGTNAASSQQSSEPTS